MRKVKIELTINQLILISDIANGVFNDLKYDKKNREYVFQAGMTFSCSKTEYLNLKRAVKLF